MDKNAKLTIKLKADSGYSSTVEAHVSPDQWKRINEIINEIDKKE